MRPLCVSPRTRRALWHKPVYLRRLVSALDDHTTGSNLRSVAVLVQKCSSYPVIRLGGASVGGVALEYLSFVMRANHPASPLLLWLVLLLHTAAVIVLACPSVCQCIGVARVAVYCDYRGLTAMPTNIPLATTHLFLMGNNFTRVQPAMFVGYVTDDDGTYTTATSLLTQLKVIRLDLNPIAIVNEHAFETAVSLELIYLPFDVRIERQAFVEMKYDKQTFDGFTRVPDNPLEDPLFVAFSKY